MIEEKVDYEKGRMEVVECNSCGEVFKKGDEVVTVSVQEETLGDDKDIQTIIHESFVLSMYHKKCSPVKLNKILSEQSHIL